MYFKHFLIEQLHGERSILSITLEWTFLICSTASYSLETSSPLSSPAPLFIYLPPFLPSSPLPFSPILLLYVSLLIPPSLPFSLSSFSFLPSSLSLFLPLPLSFSNPLPSTSPLYCNVFSFIGRTIVVRTQQTYIKVR